VTTNENPHPGIDVVRAIEIIQTTLTRRGDGVDKPIRIVTQYWAKSGELMAEADPYADTERSELLDSIRLLKGEVESRERDNELCRQETGKVRAELAQAQREIARLLALKQKAEERFAGLQDAALKKLRRSHDARRPR
jgi:hypothetical protein